MSSDANEAKFGQHFFLIFFSYFFFSNLREQFIKCISHIDVQKNLARVVRVDRVVRIVRAQKLLLVHHRVARARRTSNTQSSRVLSTQITREYRVEYIYSLRFDLNSVLNSQWTLKSPFSKKEKKSITDRWQH